MQEMNYSDFFPSSQVKVRRLAGLVALVILVLGAVATRAVPLPCETQCVWDPVVECGTSCYNVEAGFTVTCGGYNGACYNYPVCGNGICERPPLTAPPWVPWEVHGNCPRDCTDGAAVDRNACVPFVEDKFGQISTSDRQFKINNKGGSATGEPQWLYIEDHTWSECHFQGIARLRQSPWIAMVANTVDNGTGWPFLDCRSASYGTSSDGAQLFLARMDSNLSAGDGAWGSGWSSSQDRVQSHLLLRDVNRPLSSQWHPGGIQAIGDYLLLGTDSDTYLYTIDVSDPYRPSRVNSVRLDYLPGEVSGNDAPDVKAHGLGAVQDADGHYLVATNSNNKDAWMFRSQTTDIANPGYLYLGKVQWSNLSKVKPYDGLGLVRECGTNTIYLLTFFNTQQTGITGTNKAQLWRLAISGGSISASYVRTRSFADAGSAFFAGVGLYVQGSTGRMAIYSSERYPNGAVTWPWQISNKDLDCDEWW